MSNKDIQKIICCPKCKKDLQFGKFILCKNCKITYRKKNEILILIDEKNLTPHLLQQISYFEKEKASISSKYEIAYWQQLYVKRFLENSTRRRIVYDCGSGSGYMAIELAKLGYFVIVSDLTFNSVNRVRRIAKKLKIDHRMYFICSLAEELPIKSNSITEFIAHAVLEHLTNEKEAISDWKRVVVKNGRLFITVPLQLKYVFPLLWLPNIIHDKRIGHLRRYDKTSLKRKFSLPLERIYYSGHLVKILGIFMSILGFGSLIGNYCEKKDEALSGEVKWANNISVIFTKK